MWKILAIKLSRNYSTEDKTLSRIAQFSFICTDVFIIIIIFFLNVTNICTYTRLGDEK